MGIVLILIHAKFEILVFCTQLLQCIRASAMLRNMHTVY